MSRVLLDENCPAGAARGLEAAGHEVAMVATLSPGLDDRGVLAPAMRALRLPTMEGFVVVTRRGLRRRRFGVAGSGTPR